MQNNNLSPRSELMTFIGLVEGTKGYIFMRSPNNVVFTAIQALFDETLLLKCPNMHHPGYAPVGLPSDGLQGENNRPPDNENEENRGGLPDIPPADRNEKCIAWIVQIFCQNHLFWPLTTLSMMVI